MSDLAISQISSVGIIGGTGPAGRAFASRLALNGYQVLIGSRSHERAEEACAKVASKWPGKALDIRPADNAGAAGADLVVVATPWDSAASTAAESSEYLAGKVVISMANAITRIEDELQPLTPARGSVAAGVQAALPDSFVVAAMHHVPARELGDLDSEVECDVLVCTDFPDAKEVVMALLDSLPNLRSVDAGRLSSATSIESLTAILLGINIRCGTRTSLRLNGLP